jgi:hypothetical protein
MSRSLAFALASAWMAWASSLPVPAAPVRWDFNSGADGWTAAHDCTVTAADGALRVTSSGPDPFIHSAAIRVQGPVQVRMRARFSTSGQARLYWTVVSPSLVSSSWSEAAVVYFDVAHDNQWRELTIPHHPSRR